VSTPDHRAPTGPTTPTPPGAFVAEQHRNDCARFLAELAAQRAIRLENTAKQSSPAQK
jgi:hypothetical protein